MTLLFGILCPFLLLISPNLRLHLPPVSLLSAILVTSFFASDMKLLISSIIWSSFYFLDISGMLLVSNNLRVVFLPSGVSSSLQNFVPLFINADLCMAVFVGTVTSIHSEFGLKKLVLRCCRC